MHKGRVEAFSDGVLAIIITIMVLELKVPHAAEWADLTPLWPVFLSYVLSFVYIAIYWNNHHHLYQAVKHVNDAVLWANAHLLFWLSIIPFVTAWMGENHFAAKPVTAYGAVLLMCAISYTLLTRALVSTHGKDSHLALALGRDGKGWISLAIYVIGIGLASAGIGAWAAACYVVVAIVWLVPDRRFEKLFLEAHQAVK